MPWLEDHMAQNLRDDIRRHGGLISVAGLAVRWNVTRQRVRQYMDADDFPQPIPVEGSDVLVYLASECDAWKRDRESRFG